MKFKARWSCRGTLSEKHRPRRQRRKEKGFENGLTEDQKEKRKKGVWIQWQWESCWKTDRSEWGAAKQKVHLQQLRANCFQIQERLVRLLYQLGAQVFQHVFILGQNSSVLKKKAGQPGH